MFFNYGDYYFVFVLIILLLITTVFNKNYLSYKFDLNTFNKSNISNLYINNFLIMFLFVLLNIFNLNYEEVFLNVNLQIIYKLFIYLFSFFFLLMLKQYCYILKSFQVELIWILVFSIFCLSLLINAKNFLYFFVILESYSLSVLSSLAIKKINKKHINASFNYLVFNLFISCIMLYLITLIYFSSGSLNINDINEIINSFYKIKYIKLLNLSLILLVICFFVKLSIFPFSLYLLDIYSNMSFIFIFFFLIIPKFCFSLFILNNFLIIINNFNSIFIYFLILTSFVHSLLACKSISIKNLIINTSFANIPFFVCIIFCKNIFMFTSFLNFFLIYFLNLFSIFCLLFCICINKKIIFKKFVNLYGIFSSNLFLGIIITTFFLSLSSLPPFSGFFAKFFIFYLLIEYKMYGIYFLLSIINLFIVYSYIKVFKLIFYKKRNFYIKNFYKKNTTVNVIVSLLFVLNILFVIFFDLLYKFLFVLTNFNII